MRGETPSSNSLHGVKSQTWVIVCDTTAVSVYCSYITRADDTILVISALCNVLLTLRYVFASVTLIGSLAGAVVTFHVVRCAIVSAYPIFSVLLFPGLKVGQQR